MRRALRGTRVLFHVAGYVASSPVERVWELNAQEDWLGLVYPDSKHAGERAALEAAERHGIELVIVNPGYVLGVPVNRSQPGETSTRAIGNYLRGRLPAVIHAPMNFVDVEDVAIGHLLAAERGTPGERYILGGENVTWPRLIDRVAELSGVRNPIMALPTAIGRAARVREALGLPGGSRPRPRT
jgi:dihydroflavonol-4-reductase